MFKVGAPRARWRGTSLYLSLICLTVDIVFKTSAANPAVCRRYFRYSSSLSVAPIFNVLTSTNPFYGIRVSLLLSAQTISGVVNLHRN